jgi:hypothetical protein
MSPLARADAKAPRTPTEKVVVFCVAIVAVGAVFGFGRRHALDAAPIVTIPNIPIPSPNGFDLLIQATHEDAEPDCTVRFVNHDPAPISPGASDAETVAADSQAFADVKRGLALPVQTDYGYMVTWLGERHALESLGRTLWCKAAIDEQHGRWDDAASTCLDAVAMGETIQRNAPLTAKTTGNRITEWGRMCAWAAVPHLDSAAAKADAARLWAIEMGRTPLIDTFKAQRDNQLRLVVTLMQDTNWRGEVATVMAIDAGQPAADLTTVGKQDLIDHATKSWNEIVSQLGDPYSHMITVAPDYIGTPLDLVDIARLVDTSDSAQNRMLATALALQAYHADHASYPPTLDPLCPGYLPAVGVDPFSGGPLTYRLSGKSYLLYSVGPDTRDDGGKPVAANYVASDPMRPPSGDVVAGVDI